MIEPIIRLCIKDYENTADKKVREKYSILGGLLGIFCNLFLFASKFAVGMMSNSIAILSDAFNNLTDIGSSDFSIISAKLSKRLPQKAGKHFPTPSKTGDSSWVGKKTPDSKIEGRKSKMENNEVLA